MKRLKGRQVAVLSLVLILVLIIAACVAPAAPQVSEERAPEVVAQEAEGTESAAAQASKAFRVAMDTPVQLDPAFASSDSEIAILNAIYDYLVDVDHENNIQPRLSSNWRISSDGLTYVFSLDAGVTFHDGSALTADDVVWTFERLRNPELELPTSDLYSNIESVSASGDLEVTFQLKQTNPFFLYDLSDNHAVVVKAGTEDFASNFNGTGPFKVTSYSPENRMEFVANEAYYIEGKPGVSTLTFIFFSDQAAAVDALRGGQVDMAWRMPTPLYLSLQNEPGIRAVAIPTNQFELVRLRSDREPGSNPLVIQAMRLATDREAIFQTVKLGLGAVGQDSPIGPLYSSYFSTDVAPPAPDPQAAKALLADAGYPDGLQLDLHVPDSGDRPDLAVVLKEQWAEAGIDVNVIVEPESVYYGDNGWLEVDLGITGWGSRPTPQFYLDVMLVCGAKWNESHFCDAEFDELAALAGTTLDEATRIDAYRQIQSIMIERGPVIIPYFGAMLAAINQDFEGFNLKAFAGRTDLAQVR